MIPGRQAWRSIMTNEYYRFGSTDRRRFLADTGFVRDSLRIWLHPDGRAIGEGVAIALADEAFFRFLKIDPPQIEVDETEISIESITEIEKTTTSTTDTSN